MNKREIWKIVFLVGAILGISLCLTGLKWWPRAKYVRIEKEGIRGTVKLEAKPEVKNLVYPKKPRYVRGIHLTAWTAGSPTLRYRIEKLFEKTELNTVVIDVKEAEGQVYIPGVRQAKEFQTYVAAMPDIAEYIAGLKKKGIYPIARIVVFKDNLLPRKKPEWAVKDISGDLWKDRKGKAWLNPCLKETWEYNLSVAEQALKLGFEEIQFDYVRFPSDGSISRCVYGKPHDKNLATSTIVSFLQEANRRLKSRGANISIDVFGLSGTALDDMGIGQKLSEMSEWVDFVSPMMYPSHYRKGSYGLANPNREPYLTVYNSLKDAKKRVQSVSQLRPFLQDFSLGYHYGPREVRAQIQAAYDQNVREWLLWNPVCVYTKEALLEKKYADTKE